MISGLRTLTDLTNRNIKNRYKILHRISIGLLVLFVCLVSNQLTKGQGMSVPSYQVKAAFIYNFTRFVEWPEQSFKSDDEPFIIGVLGNTQLGHYLEEIIKGERLGSHPIIIHNYRHINEAYNCNILFINARDVSHLKSELAGLQESNILTVSDADNFLKYGGIVRFYTQDNKIRLQINVKSAQTAQLRISSKLLNIAKIFNR